jgi:uncharacterized protein (TIGR00730 family)
MTSQKSICVYCGSHPGNDPDFMKSGTKLGEDIAKAGFRLVYGGGTWGIMGAVAHGCLDAGGEVLGVIPEFLVNHEGRREELEVLSELRITKDMHERKGLLFSESDAFIAMPGGIGTLEELVEVMTWAQLGRHSKPIVMASIKGFWRPLEKLLEQMDQSGFIHSGEKLKPIIVDDIDRIIPIIQGQLEAGAV